MGKDLKEKELGTDISQISDNFYVGRYTNKCGAVLIYVHTTEEKHKEIDKIADALKVI